jgi:hypothetical protein
MKDLLTAGDTLDFVTSVPDFPATSGYTLKYRLVPRISGAAILITAASSGADYRVIVGPATTANWAAGEYSWSSWVEKTGERYTVDSGLSQILPDPASVSAYDGRTKAQTALEDCQTALANFNATGGKVKRYAIAGREMEFDKATDIMVLVSYWTNEVRLENRAKALREGQADPSRVYVRLGRA